MIRKIFTVLDQKTGIYALPFYSVRTEAAIRDFTHACTEKESDIAKYANDFILFYIGQYDDETGLIESFQPELLLSGNSVLLNDSEQPK